MRSLTLSQWRDLRIGVMWRFRSLNNSTSKRVLDLLDPVKLMVWKVVIERVTVIQFRMDNGGGKYQHTSRSRKQTVTWYITCLVVNNIPWDCTNWTGFNCHITPTDGYSRPDIRRRIALAASVMSLSNIWRDQRLSLSTKTRIYQTLVVSVLLYASETWTLTCCWC